jgi:branched-chain amino acid transport system permease protein
MSVQDTSASIVASRSLAPSSHGYLFGFALLAAVVLTGPLYAFPVFLIVAMSFIIFASGFNLLLGFAGLLSFGHAAYFGAGAYLTAHSAKVLGLQPEFALLVGVATAAILGLIVGVLAIRRNGISFAMITLGLAQLVFYYVLTAAWTGGAENGIQSVPRGMLFGIIDLRNDTAMYYFAATIFLLSIFVVYRVTHSPFGQVLKAIRDNEQRAISLGYEVKAFKITVFVMSAALAGLGGGLKAMALQFATATDVHWMMSGEVILMTLVGGVGTVFGPVVGGFLVVTMQNYLASLGAWVMAIQGAIFIVAVLVFRQGIVGFLEKRTGLKL